MPRGSATFLFGVASVSVDICVCIVDLFLCPSISAMFVLPRAGSLGGRREIQGTMVMVY